MPPEPLAFDRKDFFKERKPSSSEPAGGVPARWREPPTTPSSHHNNHGPSSCRWDTGGGPSDFRRPFSESDGKHVASQKDRKGGNYRETTASPNGNSHPHSDFVNSWDQLKSNGQGAKNNGGGVSTTGDQRLEKSNSLGSSLDWKPLKWIRSGSLSSRGSGFIHSSSCKIIGVDSLDTKIDAQPGSSIPLQSPSGDAAPCLTPRTPDEASSCKKPRLGWGEGLAKYEKKKVDPDDIVDKEAGAKSGMVDGVSSSEPLLPSPYNLPDKSPTLTGHSECASPTTSCSFACSSSPGLEEKTYITAATVDNGTCNPSCHKSLNHTEGSSFNLENLELTEGFNLSSSLDELMQTDDTSALGSGFVRSTAMDKLQVWKADISRTLEITESEIDSLENELKSLILAASSSFPTDCNNNNTDERCESLPLINISSGDIPMETTDDSLEECTVVEDLDRESPGTATSKFLEIKESPVNLDIRSEKAECSQDHVIDDMLGVVTSCMDGSEVPTDSSSTVSIGGVVHYDREDKLCDLILASNKDVASRASDELSKILPTTHLCINILRAPDESLLKKNFAMRKRFIKFKERVVTLKFRAFHYFWKEDLRLLAIRRFGSKSQKKYEFNSRMGFSDQQKHHVSIHSRLSSSARSLSLVPTTEVVDYVNNLLSDSRVRTYRNALKMPSLILDKRERMSSRFISDNGLVENPIDVEKEKSTVNPWTVVEKDIFLDKYSLFGKDFKKIASFLQHRTIADCVEFYYKNHKSDDFQKIKKNSKGKSCTINNTYLVTSGKRLNRETNATSLDMLGAASAMVANVGTSSDQKRPCADGNDFAMLCNEQETAAADVLAGICGSISSEALGSCITGIFDPKDIHHRCRRISGSLKRHYEGLSLKDVDEETCSDDSIGEEMDTCEWTDEERSSFVKAVQSFGKDFSMISRCVRTRSNDQCKVFFSKARKRLGLDVIDHEAGCEGTTGANTGGGSDHDHDDACMVDSGSAISHHDSSFLEDAKTDVEDLHSSDCKEENAESDCNAVENKELHCCEVEDIKPGTELVGERRSNGNLEEAGNSEANEAAKLEEVDAAELEEVEAVTVVSKVSEHQLPNGVRFNGNASATRGSGSLDLRIDHGNSIESFASREPGNGFVMSNLFPERKTVSQDDVSSRLSFRKSGQRSSSTDGYHLHLPKHSLLDCAESSQSLSTYPVTVLANKGVNGSLSCNEPQSNFKLDTSLLMDPCLPRDHSIRKCTNLMSDASVSQEQKKSSSSSRSGDVKLFGQILTNRSSIKQQQQPPLSMANGSDRSHPEKPKGGGESVSYNLKFDNQSSERKLGSLDVSRSNDYSFGVESNLQLKRSYGFWDGNRIQTGLPSLPDSAVLLSKYPAAFSINSISSKLAENSSLKSGNEQRNLNVVNGFQTRELSNSNGGLSYHHHGYRSQEVVQPFTVDKLLPEMMARRKELACNGVSDPVAAIKMQYAKTQEYKNGGGGEAWTSNGSVI